MIENIDRMGRSEQCFNTPLTLSGLQGGHQLPDQDSNTRLIPLSRGMSAIVDAADYEWLNQWKWFAFTPRNNKHVTYAISAMGEGSKRYRMHRLILGAVPGVLVDHKDGNGLNNTRSNLRICTPKQNLWNKPKLAANSSGHKGVSWNKHCKKWKASIKTDGKTVCLGYFDNLEEAGAAYDAASLKLHGEFSYLRGYRKRAGHTEDTGQ